MGDRDRLLTPRFKRGDFAPSLLKKQFTSQVKLRSSPHPKSRELPSTRPTALKHDSMTKQEFGSASALAQARSRGNGESPFQQFFFEAQANEATLKQES